MALELTREHGSALPASEQAFEANTSSYGVEVFDVLLRGMSETFCLVDKDWRYVTVNSAWLDLVQLKDGPIGRTIWEAFPHTLTTPLFAKFHECKLTKRPVSFEFFSLAANRWLFARAFPAGDGLCYFLTDINERKIAADALKASRDQLSVILGGVSAGIVAYDSAGRHVFANKAAAQIFGFTSVEEFLEAGEDDQSHLTQLCDEKGERLTPNQLHRQLPSDLLIHYRTRGSKESCWASVKNATIRGPKGEVQLVITIFQDITERKKAQLENERLVTEGNETRTRLEAVFRQVSVGLMIIDAEKAEVLFKNSEVEKIWRQDVSADAFADEREFQAFHLDGSLVLEHEKPCFRAIRDGVSVHEEELEILRGDGTRGFARFSADPIRTIDGRIGAVLVSIQDVTEIRRQERASRFLDEASKVLSSTLDYKSTLAAVVKLALPKIADWCTISMHGPNGPNDIVAHADPALSEAAQELQNKFPLNWEASFEAREALRTGEPYLTAGMDDDRLREYNADPDFLRLVHLLGAKSMVCVAIKGRECNHGVIILGVAKSAHAFDELDLKMVRELGNRAGMAIDNSNLFNEAQAAIRARDEFMTLASHELKTPLTSMKLQSQVLQLEMAKNKAALSPERVAKLVQQTDRGVQQLSRLVDDMLDIARIRSGRLHMRAQKEDLSELVRELVDRFASQFEVAGISVMLSTASAVPACFDSYRVEQVLTNLFVNAIRYAPQAPLRVIVEPIDEASVQIQIRDGGPGIALADRERVFERFERIVGPGEVSGLGVGLYICRQIVEAHGGRIFIADQNPGTAFVVELPVQCRDAAT